MKKRIISMVLTFSIMLSMLPLSVLTAFAQDGILYGDADGNGKVELLDINLMERYIKEDEDAVDTIHFTEADVNADGVIDDIDVDMVKNYLVGNLDSLTPTLHTISFVTDGGGDFEPVQAGEGYPYKGEIPTPAKDNYIFVNWEMEDGDVYYQLTEVVSGDIVLTAVYEEVPYREQLNITSFSLEDQKPDVSFDITGSFVSLDEVKANIAVLPKDGSDPVTVDVKDNSNGTFTVYAPEGFNEGASYELTLGDGLTFVDKDKMFRTAYFIIKKDKVNNLKYDPDMIFIKDTAEMRYNVGGQTVDVLESALLSTEESTEDITGSFTMTEQALEVDDIVCIYETTDPRQRNYTENNYEGDAMAFIRITAVNGNNYTFESLDEEDSEEVLSMPDSFPFKVDKLPTSYGTVDINSYDAYALSMLGHTKVPEFNADDFLTFYTVDFTELTDETPVAYGQVTNVEGNTVSYKIVDKQYIDDFMGLFVSQTVDSSDILDDLDEEEVLEQVEQQALNSGFAEEAANRMVQNALQTDEIQRRLLSAGVTEAEINQLNAARAAGVGGRIKFTAGKPTVKATLLKDTHFKDGVGLALNVSVVLSFDQKLAGKTNSLKIELTAGFEQEVALGFDIDIEDRWKWYFIIPVLQDVDVTASIDIQNYTYMSVGAKVYTVSEENIQKWKNLSSATADPGVQDTIRKINKLGAKVKKLQSKGENVQAILDEINGYKEQLPTVKVDGVEYSIEQLEEALRAEDVSSAFDEVFNAQNKAESKTGMEQLMDKYKEMLEQETDWVELINQPLINQTYWIAIAAVKVNLNFVVKANMNIQLGADMEYQVGKRYNFWLHILDGKSGSSEMDLIDERFAFQFYVMGTLGIKAGVKAEIAFGILSTDLASVGANVEFGAYVKLYGYFIYYFEDLRPANTSLSQETEEMMGALYVDFGLYVTVKFKAQVFFNAFKYEPTLYDDEFPLLTAGVRQNVYDFAQVPDEEDIMYVWDDDANSTNGISMSLPETYRTMKRIDLVTGDKSQAAYDKDNFIVVFNDERFSCSDGNIIVDVPENTRYLNCEARIIWKNDKLTFSKYDTDITVPVVWTNMSQSELNEKFTASVAVGNETDGYTTVWSARYGRLDVFDLPDDAEILELIDYDSYNTGDGQNLKYGKIGGYLEKSTGLSLTNDKTWYFNVELKQYTVTVKNVQNSGGTEMDRTFTANFGESFDFSALKNTGANFPTIMKFSTFRGLTDKEVDGDPVTSMTADMAFAEKYGDNAVLYANYIDDTLIATFEFVGLGKTVIREIRFQRGTTPYFEGMWDYIKVIAGEDTGVEIEISPELAPSETSVTYRVNCRITENPKPMYKVTFDTDGGSTIEAQYYPEGAYVYKPTDPVKKGYTFDHWVCYYESGGWTVPSGNWSYSVLVEENCTIKAYWIANSYTVSFDTQESSISPPQAKTIEFKQEYGELPVLSHHDRKFLGWFTQPTGGEQVTADTIFETGEDTTLYAHWEFKKEVSADWIKRNWNKTYFYNGSGQAFEFTVDAPDSALTSDNFTVTYLAEREGAEWTTELPVNVGAYGIKLKLTNPHNDYLQNEIRLDAGMVIEKAEPSFWGIGLYVTNWVVSPTCSTSSDGSISYTLYRGKYADPGRTFVGSFDASSSFTIPSDHRNQPGGFYLVCHVSEGTNYTSGTSQEVYMEVDSYGNSKLRPSRAAAANTFAAPVFYSAAPTALSVKAESEYEGNATMTLSPEEVVLNRGKEFEVTLGLNQSVDVWGILAEIDYDVEVLELLGYTCGDIFTEEQFTIQNDLTATPYKLLATLDEIDTVSADGSFVTLKYKVKEDAPEKATTISLELLEAVGKNAAVIIDKGGDIGMAVDETSPVIEGIEDGETYCPGQTFTVSETNLESVTINGEVQTAVDGKYLIAAGEDEQCAIVVTDKAGNSTTYTVTVSHTYADTWQSDETRHWHECECGDKADMEEHEFIWVITKEAEAGVAGEKHEECKVCGYEKASVEIPALTNDKNTPTTGDNSNIALWVALLFISGGTLRMLTIKRKRKSQR